MSEEQAAAPAATGTPTSTTTLLTETAIPNAGPDTNADGQAAAGQTANPAAEAETPEAKPADKPAERVAPEKYEFKAPEGATLDADLLGEFEGVARELKLTQDEAQTVVDKLAPKVAERVAAQQAQLVEQAATDWAKATTVDPEIGGDKLSENLATAKKALDAFGTPELRALLNDSRFGNHPEVIRFMVRAGRAISEDGFVAGGNAPPKGSRSLADSLYPTKH